MNNQSKQGYDYVINVEVGRSIDRLTAVKQGRVFLFGRYVDYC